MSVPLLRQRTPLATRVVLSALFLVAVAGCSGVGPEPGATSGERRATTTSSPAASGIPTAMPPGSPRSGTANAPASITAIAALTVFYVAVDDGGVSGPGIGCGDSVVATTTGPVEFTDQIEAAMRHLLADRERFLGESGLMNALHQSELKYVSSSIEGDTVTVLLTGQPVSDGTCDDPRIQEQLRHTAMLAAGTARAEILVDGTPIEEVMSPK